MQAVRPVGRKVSTKERKSKGGRQTQERAHSRSDKIRRASGAAQKFGGGKQVKLNFALFMNL